jgi:predicted dehydrogenase
MFSGQIRDFARLLRGQPAMIATGRDGAVATAAIEAAYQSAASRRECPIHELPADVARSTPVFDPGT